MESKLRLAGHSVQWARDGLTALRRGLDETWDALVLDINLPGKDGFSVIRELRAAGLEAPVLVMTARAEIEDKIDMLDLGADDYLVKPFDLRELEARLRALMRRPPARPAASRPTATWAWIWPPGASAWTAHRWNWAGANSACWRSCWANSARPWPRSA